MPAPPTLNTLLCLQQICLELTGTEVREGLGHVDLSGMTVWQSL